MEEKRLYLVKDITAKKIATILRVRKNVLQNNISKPLGMEISSILDMYRIQHARELLRAGVKYNQLWSVSGFSSQRNMERAFEDIVY